MNSGFLESLHKDHIIPDWVAERLDRLASEELKEKAVHGLKPVFEGALERYCDALEHPEGKVMYDSRTVSPVPVVGGNDGFTKTIAEHLLDRHIPGGSHFYEPARHGIEALGKVLKENRKVRQFLLLTIGTFVAFGLLSFIARFGWEHVVLPILHYHSSSSSKQRDGSPTGGLGDDVKAAVVPQIIEHDYGVGHKMRLRWNSMGPGMTYLIYRSYGDSQEAAKALNDGIPIHGLGALIDINSNGYKYTWLSVTAADSKGNETNPSEPVKFEFTAMNQNTTVEPIAEESTTEQDQTEANQKGGQPGQRLTKTAARGSSVKVNQSPPSRTADVSDNRSSAQPPHASAQNASTNKPVSSSNKSGFLSAVLAHSDGVVSSAFGNNLIAQGVLGAKNIATDVAASRGSNSDPKGQSQNNPASTRDNSTDLLFPGPTGVTWRHDKGRNIYVSWQDVGADYHYNLYASYANDPPSFDRDGYLLRQPNGVWTPPSKGPQVYLMYVTAVNDQGQESAPSERLLVDLR